MKIKFIDKDTYLLRININILINNDELMLTEISSPITESLLREAFEIFRIRQQARESVIETVFL